MTMEWSSNCLSCKELYKFSRPKSSSDKGAVNTFGEGGGEGGGRWWFVLLNGICFIVYEARHYKLVPSPIDA